MPSLQDTAYPRFKKHITSQELENVYTPTDEERDFVFSTAKGKKAKLGCMVLLKSFQRLGRFVSIHEIPKGIIHHLAKQFHESYLSDLSSYDQSTTRERHVQAIRNFLKVQAFCEESKIIIAQSIRESSKIKEDLVDIINIAIEELVRQRHELPAFSTLLRMAYQGRSEINETLYNSIFQNLDEKSLSIFDALFVVEEGNYTSNWNRLKTEPGKLSLNNMKEQIAFVKWISDYKIYFACLYQLPLQKKRRFYSESKSLNASQMQRLKPSKRYTLVVVLLQQKYTQALDDLAEMMIKKVIGIHNSAHQALNRMLENNQERTDRLISTLYQILTARREEISSDYKEQAIETIISGKEDNLIKECEAHMAYANNNYFPFLWKYHACFRSVLFDILELLDLKSTHQDRALKDASEFIKQHRNSRKAIVSNQVEISIENLFHQNPVDVSWIPPK